MFIKSKLLRLITHQSVCRFLHKLTYSMDKAYLRYLSGTEQFQITFQYVNPELKINRQFNFCRQLKENVNTFLSRVGTNVEKIIKKKNKRKETTEGQEDLLLNVRLLSDNADIDGERTCEDLFKNYPNNIVLKLLDQQYTIIINSPWVDCVTLPTSIMANFPVYPAKFETVFTDKSVSLFTWYKSENKTAWQEIGEGFMYTPTNNDINHYLKLTCKPKNETAEGPITEVISNVTVEASPGFCPFETRHQFTEQRASGIQFRVVSYNILADLYCDSDFSRTTLFPYCPAYALSIDYRKQLIIKELIGYNADIICLQELDKKVYINDLEPVFDSLGYESTFRLKGGLVAEGLGCIYTKNRFRHLESSCIILGEQLNKDPLFYDIWEKVSKNQKLAERVLQRTTAVQLTVLESTEQNEILVVVNTHLYFHPDADHIRLLQGGLLIIYVNSFIEKLKQRVNKRISLVLCGDFNSVPECGIYQLYTTGTVPADCIDWQSNKEEAVENLSLQQPYKLASACGTPKFTNYTSAFAGCLDYIFYDTDTLEVAQVIPLPSNEELMEHVAIPSVVFPSDHISLVSDLKWR